MTHGPVPVPLKHVEEQACEMLQRERLDDDCRLDGHWPGAPQSHQTPPTAIPAGTHTHTQGRTQSRLSTIGGRHLLLKLTLCWNSLVFRSGLKQGGSTEGVANQYLAAVVSLTWGEVLVWLVDFHQCVQRPEGKGECL